MCSFWCWNKRNCHWARTYFESFFSCVTATLLLVEHQYIKIITTYCICSTWILVQMFNVHQNMNVNNRKCNNFSIICVKSILHWCSLCNTMWFCLWHTILFHSVSPVLHYVHHPCLQWCNLFSLSFFFQSYSKKKHFSFYFLRPLLQCSRDAWIVCL